MKRVLIGMVAVVIGLTVILAMNSFAQQKLPPYTIGMVTDLTGRMSDMGIANKRGMEIAVEAVNAAGGVNGRQLKVILYDGESDPAAWPARRACHRWRRPPRSASPAR